MKQVIVVRKDLKMGCGKIAGQVAHASLRAYWKTPKEQRDDWTYNHIETKIVLKVNSEYELREIIHEASVSNIPFAVVHDAGKTQIGKGTLTAVGLGPADSGILNEITIGLKLL